MTLTANNYKLYTVYYLIRGVLLLNEIHSEVLTIEELSVYLKISTSTLYKLVREHKIPCQKIGRHWRFHKKSIDHWLENPLTETSLEIKPISAKCEEID